MSSPLHCSECSTPCAVDQRYCVVCGHRLRALPRNVAATLATMAGTSRRFASDQADVTAAGAGGAVDATSAEPGGAASPTGPRDRRSTVTLLGVPLELPSPRAMAVAVMAVLAFGVVLGTSNFSLAASPLLIKVNRPVTRVTPLAVASPSTGDSGSTGSSGSSGSSGSTGSSSSSAGSSGATGAAGASGSAPSTSTKTTAGSSGSSGNSGSGGSSDDLPPIKHVWLIELGDQGYDATFARTSSDHYLNSTLAAQGEVIPQVYASATSDLANEVGLISGQGPTVQSEADCPKYSALTPGKFLHGQVRGSGCVLPASTPSLLGELAARHDSWKSYVQGLGSTSAQSCTHPHLGATDPDFNAKSAGAYVTWRNPVVYLAGLTGAKSCADDDTGLAALDGDLKTVKSTPALSLILPNPCDDGSDTPCRPGAKAGTAGSDAFLKSVVPAIMASPAYKQNGMILITFAQAPQSGPSADHSSCCDQPARFPNLPSADYEPAGTTTSGTSTVGAAPTTAGTGTTTALTGTDTSATSTGALDLTGTDTSATGTGTSGASGTDTTSTSGTGTSTTACTTTGTTTTGTTTTGTTTGTGTTGTSTTTGNSGATATTGTGTTTTNGGAGTTSTTSTGTSTTGTSTDCSSPPTGGGAGNASPTGGGGQVGMLVLSQYVDKNLQDGTDMFNTYSITASIEQLFGLKLTGYAAISGLPTFSGFVYSNYTG